MVDLEIHKINESVVELKTSDDINHNIYSRYSEFVEGHQFSPRFKLHRWNGMWNAYNVRTGIFPIGLLHDLLKWADSQRNYV